ncbi:MAG: exosortase/archaeosortase family protein [Gemmatimonadota bacterium]|nr:exosortase/archaeosortase family protein [Gemmatimonadota bacterium]
MTWIPRTETGAPASGGRFAYPGRLISDATLRAAASYSAIKRRAPALATAVAFLALFSQALLLLVQDWWQLPEAGHGLLLGPLAAWLAWHSGIRDTARPNHRAGIAVLFGAILIRYIAALAAEPFATRESAILALAALTVYNFGIGQLRWWWLPFTLAVLTVPLPELVTQQLALPLQLEASRIGANLLSSRHVPVQLMGNIIRLPGRELFVTEACSGLRSLTALISLGVLVGAVTLRSTISRLALLALAIPVAILLNGVRVFLTGFLVYFVSPAFGEGFMHATEGWVLFVVSFAALGVLALGFVLVESRVMRRSTRDV